MELKERIDKFNNFLTNFEKASGATGLCEAVRSAAKICFEGLDTRPAWADPALVDPKYKDNVVAGYGDIRRKISKDIPLSRYRARMMAKKAAETKDPAATETPVDECTEKTAK